jgi:uncharacterized membrane protein YfcA
VVLVAIATFLGASVASATGFGFALVLSPAMFAVLEPHEAVTTLLVLGLALNLLMLFGSGSRPESIRWRAVSPLLAGALPGLGAGLLLLALMSKSALQIAVGVVVIGAALVQGRSKVAAGEAPREPALRSAVAVGLASGALTTSTTVSGPPIVLWLQAHRVPPADFRSTLAACFLGLTLAGGAVLAAGGLLSLEPAVVLPLLALTVAGQVLGARVFRGLDALQLRSAVLLLVLGAGVASLAAGMSAAG